MSVQSPCHDHYSMVTMVGGNVDGNNYEIKLSSLRRLRDNNSYFKSCTCLVVRILKCILNVKLNISKKMLLKIYSTWIKYV